MTRMDVAVMTEARIAREFPDLADPEAVLKLLAETLEVARGVELVKSELAAAGEGTPEYAQLLERFGLPAEIEAAGETARATVLELLARVSERDLEEGRDTGLLLPNDYTQALKAKRSLSLRRGRGLGRDRDFSPER